MTTHLQSATTQLELGAAALLSALRHLHAAGHHERAIAAQGLMDASVCILLEIAPEAWPDADQDRWTAEIDRWADPEPR